MTAHGEPVPALAGCQTIAPRQSLNPGDVGQIYQVGPVGLDEQYFRKAGQRLLEGKLHLHLAEFLPLPDENAGIVLLDGHVADCLRIERLRSRRRGDHEFRVFRLRPSSRAVFRCPGRENGLYEPAVLLNLEALARFTEQYRNRSGQAFAGKTYSLADVIKETHQALNENRPEFYRLPGERRIIAQELLLFENSGSDDLEVLTDSQFSKARLSVKVLRDDAAAYVQLVRAIEAEAARLFRDRATVTFTGTVRLFTQTIQLSLESMGRSYLLAAGVITLLMLLLLGSVRMGLLSMIPNLGLVVVTMGLMGWVGIPLDMSNILLGAIVIGLAVDDTIHFFHVFRRNYSRTGNAAEAVRRTMLTTGRAILITTQMLVTGFWLFMFSSLNNLIQFGFLIGLTLILALLADLLLAPALLELVTRARRPAVVPADWREPEII